VVEKNTFFIVLLLLWLTVSSGRAANTIYVDVASPNDPGSGTFEDPFRRIQAAIDNSVSGDIVEIRPGVYSGSGNRDLDPGGKSITIRSIKPDDEWFVSNTVIDPNDAGRGFNIHGDEDANCIISGLTIRNARIAIGDNGAGIYCYNCSPIISNCVIRDCSAEGGSGGGICFDYGSAAIINCTIAGNFAGHYGYGGGISCRFSSPTIIGCTISGNSAAITGGGIDSGASEPNILNCIIIDNNALGGGGINCYYPGDTNVVNCTIAANSADYFGGGVYCWSQGSAIIKNSIIWANSAPEGTQLGMDYEGTISAQYCDIQDGQTGVYDPCGLLAWGQGNIDVDPCFVSFIPGDDPNLCDFHLQSSYGRWNPPFYRIDFNNDGIINLAEFAELAEVWLEQGNLPQDIDNSGIVDWPDLELFAQYYLANSFKDGWVSDVNTSPCVDAGDPNSDWTAEPWPNGKRINIGAYGGTNQAGKSGNIADINIDGKVNFTDFAMIASLWNKNTGSIEDLTRNGVVNVDDLEILAKNWLWEK